MALTTVKSSIRAALEHEERYGAFRRKIQAGLDQFREKLLLPDEAPADTLMQFVVEYVESVPGCLNLVSAVSKRFGFYDYAAPFLQVAESYFLQPPDLLRGDAGLEAVLDEAFLAHRLLEEVNDHHIRHLRRPLLPVDMTEANLVVHYLLGDAFATDLEKVVQRTTAQLLFQEHLWERVKALPCAEQPDFARLGEGSLSRAPPRIRLRLGGG